MKQNLLKVCTSVLLVTLCAAAWGGPGARLQGKGKGKASANESPVVDELDSASVAAADEFDAHWDSVGVFSSAQVCATCHKASTDGSGVMRIPRSAAGTDISPFAGWRHSMMAQAWTDPYFQATVEDQVTEFPAYAGDIEDKCLTCHSPMAHSYAHDTGLGLDSADCSLGAACYRMETAAQDDHAREGVSCTLCHQMVEDDSVVPGSGNFSVPGAGDPGARTIFGPYLNPVARPMEMNTDYTVRHSNFISSSEHCASCHDLSTPTFDINTGYPAEPAASFREQAAYGEWLNSSYGDGDADDQSCQDCHMQSPDNYATPIAVTRSGNSNGGWPERSPYPLHGVAGGNTYVLGLLKTWREELGIAGSTTEQGFAEAIDSARQFLQQAAVISLTCQSRDASRLDLCVSIENRTGHKLPTGYPSRRMWVQLTVSDQHGAIVFDSGRPDERGYLPTDERHMDPLCLQTDKEEGFRNGPCYESHQNIITRPEQVAVYEAVMADTNGNITYSLLYGAGYLKDNRIPPKGFTSHGSNYDEETAVVGKAIQDTNFNSTPERNQGSGRDSIFYKIPVAEADGPLLVEARLWYASIRPAFIGAMPHGGEKTQRMKEMFQLNPPLPELLGMDAVSIE